MEPTTRSPSRESVAHANIQVIAEHSHLPSLHFRSVSVGINEEGAPIYAIKTNSLARRVIYALTSSHTMIDRRRAAVVAAMRESVTVLSKLPIEKLVNKEGHTTRVFLDAQRFNQSVAANRNTPSSIAESFTGRITSHHEQMTKELSPVRTDIRTIEPTGVDQNDRPERKPSGHLAYPRDVANHDAEAARIFLLTQLERLASTILHLFTDRFDYFRGGLTEADIRTNMTPIKIGSKAPSSYWVGHSTCLMNIPLHDQRGGTKAFNVLTDPVEGDLNPILYPRKTRPGRKVEEGPAIHVMLLSHNHLDHYSAKTIKKLLSMQPVMVVPEGDGHLFRDLGFKNVREQNWWHKVDLILKDDVGGDYHMGITTVPSRHWAGQGPLGGAESTFVGHVISGADGGDIYYAGDTARMEAGHLDKLRKKFNIRWMYQPGGPDERRADMQSTHQASADSLWMTSELLLKRKYLELRHQSERESPEKLPDRQTFKEICKGQFKTLLMHTSTFKLGNLHADDTIRSIDRVIRALDGDIEAQSSLEEYELEVLALLLGSCDEMNFAAGPLTPKDLAEILAETVYVPKIGSRIDFDQDKISQLDRTQQLKTPPTAQASKRAAPS